MITPALYERGDVPKMLSITPKLSQTFSENQCFDFSKIVGKRLGLVKLLGFILRGLLRLL